MRRKNFFAVAAALLLSVGAVACDGNPVGRICFIGDEAGVDQAIVASPALECPSRTCLHQPPQVTLPDGQDAVAMCTADCEADEDCDKVPESPCETGFTCAVPVVVGPFCCRKMCICKDYLDIPEGGLALPAACDPNDEANTCINLPGRGS